jgi:hypothetical protein
MSPHNRRKKKKINDIIVESFESLVEVEVEVSFKLQFVVICKRDCCCGRGRACPCSGSNLFHRIGWK